MITPFSQAADATTTVYDFVSCGANCDGSTSWWASADDVDQFPFGGSDLNRNTHAEATDAQYGQIAISDNVRWMSADPGTGDEILFWIETQINESVSTISQINLTFEGYLNNQTSVFQIYALRAGQDWIQDVSWAQVGSGQTIVTGADSVMVRSITANVSDYINPNGIIVWVVYGVASNQSMLVDYVKTEVVYTTPSSSQPPLPSSGTKPSGLGPTVIRFTGRSYPGSEIEVFRKILNEPYTAVAPEIYDLRQDGAFEIQFSAILQGDFSFALRATDAVGRKSNLIYFSLLSVLQDGALGVDGILMPPTLEFTRQRVTQGQNLEIVGYSFPGRLVNFIIDNNLNKDIFADEEGKYRLSVDTSDFSLGEHQIRARYNPRLISPEEFSPLRIFRVSALEFVQADFNEDETVDIADWSIFLFRTRSADEFLKKSIDLDGNSKVDIFDFSIFLDAFSKLK